MCNNRNFFLDVALPTSKQDVSVGNEEAASVIGIGTIRVVASYNGQRVNIGMKHALFVPDLMANLLSVSKLRQAGFRTTFDTTSAGARRCFVTRSGCQKIVFEGVECQDGLYRIDISAFDSTLPQSLHTTTQRSELDKQNLWNRRLGHVSCEMIEKSIPFLDGIDITKCRKLDTCQSCLKSKWTRDPRKPIDDRSTQPLNLVHSDLIGPFKSASLGASKYCTALFDDCSTFSLVRFTKTKAESLSALQDMIIEL